LADQFNPLQMKGRILFLILVFTGFALNLSAQEGIIRGNLFDKDSGEPIIFANVILENTNFGVTTDIDGFFNLSRVPAGNYTLVASYIGYETVELEISLTQGAIEYRKITMTQSGIGLNVVDISAKRERARSETQVSKIKITQKEIQSLPAIGGEADILQYLQLIPGIIATGDQGGQLYIRGGSPIQNKIMLDGITIINPFHSIGSFSVFETEIIKNVDVITGGFNAEHGGRISAVVDISTREGNKNHLSGVLSASPFMAKALLEGPIIRYREDRPFNASFILTGKQSLIDRTSMALYPYINREDSVGLPYKLSDYYGKLSLELGAGSKMDLFGFSFNDRYNYPEVADIQWQNRGGGMNFKIVPSNSNIIINARAGYSAYLTELVNADGQPRLSELNGFVSEVDFTVFGDAFTANYGFEINGVNTNFEFVNPYNVRLREFQNTTEINAYTKFSKKWNRFIFEPGLRAQFYASLGDVELEPRISMKYNINKFLRLKAAGGWYSQNLISTSTERDVVNLFVGFISSPEERVYDPFTEANTNHKLQKALQGVFGIEYSPTSTLDFNLEGYYKEFDQMIVVNRNKQKVSDPNYVVEKGDAYGMDLSARYQVNNMYFYGTYSLGFVQRDDSEQVYPTIFDRRHNINLLSSMSFGPKNSWEISARWNFGSGFPFTKTQGFFDQILFQQGANTEYETENPDHIGVIYSEARNGGRLPYYHRLDISFKKTMHFTERVSLEILASVTNVYDRDNIFYFDRIRYERVNQLPILPTLGLKFSF
jgi:hypothetical protein